MASVTLIKLDRASGESDAAYSARRGREIAQEVLRKKGRSTSVGEPVEIRNRTAAPVDLEARIASSRRRDELRVNNRADEAMALLAKRERRAPGCRRYPAQQPEVYEASARWRRGYEADRQGCGTRRFRYALTIKKHLEAGATRAFASSFHASPRATPPTGR